MRSFGKNQATELSAIRNGRRPLASMALFQDWRSKFTSIRRASARFTLGISGGMPASMSASFSS